MPDKRKDDVAAALAALAGGQVPSEHETPSGGIPSETTVFAPPPPEQPLAPPAAVDAPPPPAAAEFRPPRAPVPNPRSASPSPRPTQSKFSAPPLPPGATPPPARSRPAVPTLSSDTTDRGVARIRPNLPEKPAAPKDAPAPEPAADDGAGMLSNIVEDDQMEAPAPDISTLARTPIIRKKSNAPLYANLKFRRTVIPMLLTNGILLPGIGAWAIASKDSPLHEDGLLLPIVLFSVGAVLLATGVLNALHVKQILLKANQP